MSQHDPVAENFAGDGRGWSIALVAVLALGQAAAAAMAAFATRDVFAAFRDDVFRNPSDPGPGCWSPPPVLAIALPARGRKRVVAERVGQDYAASLRLQVFSNT